MKHLQIWSNYKLLQVFLVSNSWLAIYAFVYFVLRSLQLELCNATPVAGQTRPTAWRGWSLSCEIWAFPGNMGIHNSGCFLVFWDESFDPSWSKTMFSTPQASKQIGNQRLIRENLFIFHLLGRSHQHGVQSVVVYLLTTKYRKKIHTKKILDLNILRLFRVWSRRLIRMSQGHWPAPRLSSFRENACKQD